MVPGSHKTDVPSILTYSSIISCGFVFISFKIASLNDLKVPGYDIQNVYLTSPTSEKLWTRVGAEFGSKKGNMMLIVRALYGLKCSSAAFRDFLADTLDVIDYMTAYADPDVWM